MGVSNVRSNTLGSPPGWVALSMVIVLKTRLELTKLQVTICPALGVTVTVLVAALNTPQPLTCRSVHPGAAASAIV